MNLEIIKLLCIQSHFIPMSQISFTSITTWKILNSGKLPESLKNGMQQLCNNIMGHLVSLNYYPVLKVGLSKLFTNKKYLQILQLIFADLAVTGIMRTKTISKARSCICYYDLEFSTSPKFGIFQSITNLVHFEYI